MNKTILIMTKVTAAILLCMSLSENNIFTLTNIQLKQYITGLSHVLIVISIDLGGARQDVITHVLLARLISGRTGFQ